MHQDDPLAELFDQFTGIAKQMEHWGDALARFAHSLDAVGDADKLPEGSNARRMAELRDHADFCLSHSVGDLIAIKHSRAHTSRYLELVVDSASEARGDGVQFMKLMERYHELAPEEVENPDVESFPDQFLWDLAQRVEAFPELAERYPEHCHFAARHLQGLPMMVARHIDVTHEFRRLAEMLRVGTRHPFDVSHRKKRGGITPAMRYLEPLVWRMNTLRESLREEARREGGGVSAERVNWLWTLSYSRKTPEAEIEILRRLPTLPALTKKCAPAWSKEIIVPYILETDGKNPASATKPFLKNIWKHRSVKSPATFRSRLESAVTDFLTRYSRERYPDEYS
jgi:hypothetical protein